MLRTYELFCTYHFSDTPKYPSTHCLLSSFISYLFINNYQPSTIASHISAISYVHKLYYSSDPTDTFFIKKMLKGCQNLRPSSDSRLPITKDILNRLNEATSPVLNDAYCSTLIKAMMSLAYFCFLRIGEIAVKNDSSLDKVIQLENINIEKISEKNWNMSVTVQYYKHSNMQPKILSLSSIANSLHCPVYLMYEYLRIRPKCCGPLFIFRCGSPIPASYFNSTLKKLVEFIGLNPKFYKGHSFRIGAATSAAARGVPLAVIQSMGRWKSNAFQNYIRLNTF